MEDFTRAVDAGLTSFTSRYDLDATIVADLRNTLLEAGATHVKTVAVASRGAGRPRKRTAYNIYIKEEFARAKENNDSRNSQELMSAFSQGWAKLTDDEKKPYHDKAAESNDAGPTSAAAPKKRMNGYNLYYKENKEELKKEADEAGERLMKHVGASWKALSEEEQKVWRDKAAAL